MKSAVVNFTILVVIFHAGFVQTRMVTRISRKEGHQSERERSQSAPISSRGQLNKVSESISRPAELSESKKMDIPADIGKNGDQSYVLVPLQDLMRNRRDSADVLGEDQDPLYVMFPFQEIVRKTRDIVGHAAGNITSPIESGIPGHNGDLSKVESRERREIGSQAKRFLKTKRIAKRRPHMLSVRRERMSLNGLDEDYDNTLRGEPPARPNSGHTPASQFDKRRNAYMVEPKGQLHPEMFDGLHQKSRVLTDFSDLSTKALQTVIGKPKKSAANPINITMFISNLIPPNEVENTRITNAGKLYKSGCLKFSIQLERPGACSCSPEDTSNDDPSGKTTTCSPVVTQKVACIHSFDEKGKPVEGPSSNPPGSCGPGPPTSKAQSGSPETSDTNRINDPATSNKDVSSLLLQLIGADKKIPKKPATSPGQAIFMDNEILKELQKLFANQLASKGPDPTGRSVSATAAPAAPMSPNSQKAKAIAEALNLFSRYSSLKQNSM